MAWKKVALHELLNHVHLLLQFHQADSWVAASHFLKTQYCTVADVRSCDAKACMLHVLVMLSVHQAPDDPEKCH